MAVFYKLMDDGAFLVEKVYGSGCSHSRLKMKFENRGGKNLGLLIYAFFLCRGKKILWQCGKMKGSSETQNLGLFLFGIGKCRHEVRKWLSFSANGVKWNVWHEW